VGGLNTASYSSTAATAADALLWHLTKE